MFGDLKAVQWSVVLGAFLLVIVLSTVGVFVRANAESTQHDKDVSMASNFTVQQYHDKHAALALFIPATDINGASNTDGHAWDYYRQDTNKNGLFIEYCYRAAAADCNAPDQALQTVAEYSYDNWTEREAGAGYTLSRQPIGTFTGMQMVEEDGATAIAALPEIGAVPGGLSCTQTVYHWAYPGVTSATCRVYHLSVTTGTYNTIYDMADNVVPFSRMIVTGDQTPSPNPEQLSVGSLSFYAPVAPALTTTVSESNYGNRRTTPPQIYTLGTGCNVTTTITPASPVTPIANGTGDATLTILPKISLANGNTNCGIGVTDNTPQTQTVSVTIGAVDKPAATGLTIAFTPGAKANVTTTEQDYALPAPSGRGGITLFGYLSSGADALTSADTGGDPLGVCATAPGTSGRAGSTLSAAPAFIETETWSITFSKPGVCFPVFEDVYGQLVAVNGTNGIQATSEMSSFPEQIEVAQDGGEVSLVPHHAFDLAEFVNGALLGGVADAATTPGCHAYALTTGGAPEAAPAQANALGIFTDANGCYTNSSGTPVSNAAIVLWEPDGQTETFKLGALSCPAGTIIPGLFNPGDNGVQVDLPLTGGSTTGACSIAITDGVTTTPTVDHGLTAVNVVPSGCVAGIACNVNFFFVQNECFRPDAGGCAGGSESLEEGFTDTSTDGGQTWAQGTLISVKILCENENGEQCIVPPLTGPPGDGDGVTGLNGTFPASQFSVLGESASGSWFTGATAITEPTFPTIPPGM
jgi:hypothetical protein